MATIIITDVREPVPAIDPARAGKQDRLVYYSVDGNPRIARIPAEGFSKEAAVAFIRKELDSTKGLTGHTFQH